MPAAPIKHLILNTYRQSGARFVFLVGTTLLVASCAQQVPLEGLDVASFAADGKACNGYRASLQGKVAQATQPLIGHDEKDVVKTLGSPDITELAGRSQKFFKYYLTPAPTCKGNASPAGQPDVLLVRFNSLNRVNEISIRTEVSQ